MKRYAIILVLVGVFTFYSAGTAVAGSPATLCIEGITAHLIATYVGTVGEKYVFQLSGWLDSPPSKNTLVSGTATIYMETIHWGFTLLNAIDFSSPYVFEFTTDYSLEGEGELQDLTGLELSLKFVVTNGSCPFLPIWCKKQKRIVML